jgi:carboxyl-terminal processing protease
MNESNTPPSRPSFPPFLLLLALFAAGVFCERAGWIPGRGDQAPPGVRKTFAPFWEAWNKVKENYVDRSKVDDKRMTGGAISGMLRSLGDEGHTTYLTKEERERASENLSGQMQGIGARVSMRQGKPTIIQAMPNSPARAAGLRSGDVILLVDDQPVDNLTLGQVVSRVRGPAGTEVRLRIGRTGETASIIVSAVGQAGGLPYPWQVGWVAETMIKTLDLTVKRARVEVPEVSWQILPGQPALAHLSLQRFSKNSGKQMKEALEQLLERGVKGLILDVRGNEGGYKDQCIEVVSEFLREGTVLFIQQDPRGNQEKITALKGGVALDLPLCLLINQATASSSEILAGALQDNGRARLIGTRTYGTGTVLREYPLSDGSAVRLAIYQWLTPHGREIWHKGIQPDKGLEVSLPPDGLILLPDSETILTEAEVKKSGDAPLLKAIEVMREELGVAGKERGEKGKD